MFYLKDANRLFVCREANIDALFVRVSVYVLLCYFAAGIYAMQRRIVDGYHIDMEHWQNQPEESLYQ
jgi:hypothetical protein